MHIELVDPRDEAWDRWNVRYRVHFWSREGHSAEYEVTDADVPKIIAWATQQAEHLNQTYSVLAVEPIAGGGVGVLRLCGWDPNINIVAGEPRPEHARACPS